MDKQCIQRSITNAAAKQQHQQFKDSCYCLSALHGFRLDVVVSVVLLLEITNLDAASAFREHGETEHGESNRDFLIAGKGTRDNHVAHLALYVHDGAAVVFATGTTASTRQTRSSKLAADLHVKAAKSNLT